MFEKIIKLYKNPNLQQLRDVRVAGLIIFGILVILVSWSGSSVIQSNYDLQRQISKLEQQNAVQQLENNNLKLRNEYYNTDQYLELAARRYFGKALPGEKLLLVPKNVALAHTIELPGQKNTQVEKSKPHKPAYQQNFEAWMRFFTHRQIIQE